MLEARVKHPPISDNQSLLAEWDFSKNLSLDPNKLTQGSPKKAWWKCSMGHEWEARINTRLIYKCPHCVGKGMLKPVNILWNRDDVKRFWAEDKNQYIDPKKIGRKSTLKVWCRCPDCSSEWQQLAVNRMRCLACAERVKVQKEPKEKFSLLSAFPAISKEWDYEKNRALKPDLITGGSHQKAWWKCSKGHEWQSSICDRTASKSKGCPYCSLRLVDETNNLAVTHPQLAEEWGYEKNGDLDIHSVTATRNIRAWWKCSKGHEWRAIINTRTNGARCPYCIGKLASEESNLEIEFPLIAEQWHPSKNEGRLPNEFRPKSSHKAWWVCNRMHEWRSAISSRTSSGTGCPICKPSTSKAEIRVYSEFKGLFEDTEWRADFEGKEIDVYIPSLHLAIEIDGYVWHKEKVESDTKKNLFFESHGLTIVRLRDDKLAPLGGKEFPFNSSSLDDGVWFSFVGWIAKSLSLDEVTNKRLKAYVDKGVLINDELSKTILSRLPSPLKEKSLESLFPELMKEWDYEGNLPFTPDMFTAGSGEKVWWRCSQDHSWKANINTRVNNHGCPYCGKGEGKRRKASKDYNLALVNPSLIPEWSDKNELPPTEVSPNAQISAWWKCSKGHEWQATVASRNAGRVCPYCSGRLLGKDNSLKATMPELVKEWDAQKNDLKPEEVMQRSNYKAWWKCSTCGHEWQARVYSRAQGRGCIKCSYTNGSRKPKAKVR